MSIGSDNWSSNFMLVKLLWTSKRTKYESMTDEEFDSLEYTFVTHSVVETKSIVDTAVGEVEQTSVKEGVLYTWEIQHDIVRFKK